MALPLFADMTPEPERPEEAIKRVLETIRRLKDRTDVMRSLQQQDDEALRAFEQQVKPEWEALEGLRRSYEAQSPAERDIDALDRLIDHREKTAEFRRRAHGILLEMIRGVAKDAAPMIGQSEQWLLGAFAFAARPFERSFRHLMDLTFALEELAADVDPDAGPAGDVISEGADMLSWHEGVTAS